MADSMLHPRSALEGFAHSGRHGAKVGPAGVIIRERRDVAITLVMASRSEKGAASAISRALGAKLPETPRTVDTGDQTILWCGPEAWLVIRPSATGGGETEAETLAQSLGPAAAVIDVTDSRTFVTVSGAKARAFLEKGVAVDLHDRSFTPGDTAITALDHMVVQLWLMDSAPTFGLLIPRATAGHLWHWIETAAAEFGLDVAV